MPVVQLIRARLRQEQGQFLVIMGVGLVAMIGVVALAVDVAFLYWQRRDLQSMVDKSALAGAQRANFNYDSPAILVPQGADDALTYAQANGLELTDTIVINLPPIDDADDPNDDADPWNGDPRYIEVRVTRPVETLFGRIFGFSTVNVRADAVARTIRPGTGTFAVMTLDPAGLSLDTNGTAPCVQITGDIYAYGNITVDGNGLCMNGGSVWSAYGTIDQNPAGNIVDYTWICGSNSTNCPQIPFVPNPYAGWSPPYPNPPDDGDGGTGGWANIPCIVGNDCTEIDALAGAPSRFGNIRVRDNGNGLLGPNVGYAAVTGTEVGNAVFEDFEVWNLGYAQFIPGTYIIDGDVLVRSGGVLEFEPGVYWIKGNLDIRGALVSGNSCASGQGALIILEGTLAVAGGATFTLYGDPDYDYVALYSPNNDVDLAGTGDRQIQGTVYVPNGTATLSGNTYASTVSTCPDGGGGQVIAWQAVLNGGAPTVEGPPPGTGFVFSPSLVNKPTVP